MTFGKAVRQCRHKRGWSVKALSEESGVAKSTITDVEYGRRGTSVAVLIELLDTMGYELIVTEKQDGEQTQRHRIAEATIDKTL